MAHGARLASVVMFVRDLDRSISFYRELLALDVADRSPTAALLVSPEGSQLVLRAMGQMAVHPLGGTGVQYVVWTAGGEQDLHRCERVLKEHSAHSGTRRSQGITVVEGRDPDDVVVLVIYPGPDEVPLRQLPAWIYAW